MIWEYRIEDTHFFAISASGSCSRRAWQMFAKTELCSWEMFTLTMKLSSRWDPKAKDKHLLLPLPLKEPECGSGHGGELWGGLGLHHGEDHLCLFPRRRRGTQLCHQPQGGGDNAAVQTWRALSGEQHPPSEPGTSNLDQFLCFLFRQLCPLQTKLVRLCPFKSFQKIIILILILVFLQQKLY